MTFTSFSNSLSDQESTRDSNSHLKVLGVKKHRNGNSLISSHKLTGSHVIVILFTLKCQLYIWEQSHPFSSIVAFVYKLLWFPYRITSSMYSNVTTSTRINSSSVHTYICVCFIRNQYNTSSFLHRACWPYPIFNTDVNTRGERGIGCPQVKKFEQISGLTTRCH